MHPFAHGNRATEGRADAADGQPDRVVRQHDGGVAQGDQVLRAGKRFGADPGRDREAAAARDRIELGELGILARAVEHGIAGEPVVGRPARRQGMAVAGHVDQPRVGVDVVAFRVVEGIARFQAGLVGQIGTLVVVGDVLGRAGGAPQADVVDGTLEMGQAVERSAEGDVAGREVEGRDGDRAAAGCAVDEKLRVGAVIGEGDMVPGAVIDHVDAGRGGTGQIAGTVDAEIDTLIGARRPDAEDRRADRAHRNLNPGFDGEGIARRARQQVARGDDLDEIVHAIELHRPHVGLRAQNYRRVVDVLNAEGNGSRVRAAVDVIHGDGEAVVSRELGVGRVGERPVRVQGDRAVGGIRVQREGQTVAVDVFGDDLGREGRVFGDDQVVVDVHDHRRRIARRGGDDGGRRGGFVDEGCRVAGLAQVGDGWRRRRHRIGDGRRVRAVRSVEHEIGDHVRIAARIEWRKAVEGDVRRRARHVPHPQVADHGVGAEVRGDPSVGADGQGGFRAREGQAGYRRAADIDAVDQQAGVGAVPGQGDVIVDAGLHGIARGE